MGWIRLIAMSSTGEVSGESDIPDAIYGCLSPVGTDPPYRYPTP